MPWKVLPDNTISSGVAAANPWLLPVKDADSANSALASSSFSPRISFTLAGFRETPFRAAL